MAWLDRGTGEQLEVFKFGTEARNKIQDILNVKHDRKSIEAFLDSVEQRLPVFFSAYLGLPRNTHSKIQIERIKEAAEKLIKSLDLASETTRAMLYGESLRLNRRNTGLEIYDEVQKTITIAESALKQIKKPKNGPQTDKDLFLIFALKKPWEEHIEKDPGVTKGGPFMSTLEIMAKETKVFSKPVKPKKPHNSGFDVETIRRLLKIK
jgi:hypothetical protein